MHDFSSSWCLYVNLVDELAAVYCLYGKYSTCSHNHGRANYLSRKFKGSQ